VLGSACAMVPGLGASVIDWVAYAHAAKTERDTETFGSGDVRGVIAAESSTNAREGGSLIPTIAFGIPAHASMAILLSAFLVQGIVPGPDMLSKHLDITYTIVWSLTLANVIGTLICFGFANQFARIATVRYTILLPSVLVLVYMGAFEGQHSWGDIATLLVFGAAGWLMKVCDWPRPPLVLAFILGSEMERYTFLSVQRYDWAWLTNWFVLAVFSISAIAILQRVIAGLKERRAAGTKVSPVRPVPSVRAGLALLALLIFAASVFPELAWPRNARLVPQIFTAAGAIFAALLFLNELYRPVDAEDRVDAVLTYRRAAGFFLWAFGLLAGGLLIGFLPALVAFALTFMIFQGRETIRTAATVSTGIAAFLWIVFDRLVHEPWPQALIGNLLPGLRAALPWF
jgi:putative tricarboxylic transport membrane protein